MIEEEKEIFVPVPVAVRTRRSSRPSLLKSAWLCMSKNVCWGKFRGAKLGADCAKLSSESECRSRSPLHRRKDVRTFIDGLLELAAPGVSQQLFSISTEYDYQLVNNVALLRG